MTFGALLTLLGWLLLRVGMAAAWPDEIVVRCIRNGAVKVYFGRGRFKNDLYETRGIPGVRDAPNPDSIKKDMIGGGMFRKGHDFIYGESPSPGTIVWTEWNPTASPLVTPEHRQWIHNEVAKADRRARLPGLLNNPQLMAALTIIGAVAMLFIFAMFVFKPMLEAGSANMGQAAEVQKSAADAFGKAVDALKTIAEKANITIQTNVTANDTIPV